VFCLTKPIDSDIARFLERQQTSRLSYSPSDLPKFTVDRQRVVIGNGPSDFVAARAALYDWRMFPPAWTRVYSAGPLKVGLSVAVAIQHLGFWSLNGARVLYELDEEYRSGFAYGTLVDHGERGEELFAVEMDRETGDVIYNLEAASRPAHVMAWFGYPYVRELQARFRRDSAAAMMLR